MLETYSSRPAVVATKKWVADFILNKRTAAAAAGGVCD
jgi:hypothetical protein